MCGRFVGYRTIAELQRFFPIDRVVCGDATANYNVAPSQEILVIVNDGREYILDTFHWGLVPSWATDTSIGRRLINARAETVAAKPSFRAAFARRRCLIPADGFYEWAGAKGQKQPLYITLPNGDPFAFAGLWESWNDKRAGNAVYKSCTILTTSASDAVAPIHHRMPVILHPDAYDAWLAPKQMTEAAFKAMLAHQSLGDVSLTPVAPKVNSATHNHPSNIHPYRQAEFNFRLADGP